MYDEYFTNVSNHSFLEFESTARMALMQIVSDPALMCNLLKNIEVDTTLAEKTECYDFLDKMVVYSNDDIGIYARISYFHEGYSERIHNHRWNYASYILCGGYTQSIYGTTKEHAEIATIDPCNILMREDLCAGNIYALNNLMIHSIRVLPNTISICIRGKAICDAFQIKDISSGSVWWQYGSALEALEEHSMKRIPQFLLHDKISEICKIIESL
jgi:hypothetical protein